jgi:hypothetical protein
VVVYVRTVKTSSGATAVQVVWSFRRRPRKIEHIGSAHEDAELVALDSSRTGAPDLVARRFTLPPGVTSVGES